MQRNRILILALGAIALSAGLASAHHSFAVFFDSSRTVTITGVVTKFLFANPHGIIELTVAGGDGAGERWKVESNSPSILRRRGWTADSLKAGDTVTIEGWPARDGSRYLRMMKATRPNGELIGKPFEPNDG